MELTERLNSGQGAEELFALLKQRLIVAALDLAGGNICAAAIKLKVHRNTLMRWMRELEINPREFRRRRAE